MGNLGSEIYFLIIQLLVLIENQVNNIILPINTFCSDSLKCNGHKKLYNQNKIVKEWKGIRLKVNSLVNVGEFTIEKAQFDDRDQIYDCLDGGDTGYSDTLLPLFPVYYCLKLKIKCLLTQ